MRHILFAFLILMTGCGGGTSGTSSTGGYGKVFRGRLASNGVPLEGATVKLVQTGTSAVSATDGLFTINSPQLPDTSATFEVSGTNQAAFELKNLDPGISLVALNADLDGATDAVAVDQFELVVDSISGEGCNGAFDKLSNFQFLSNGPQVILINQTAPITPGTVCNVAVSIRSNGNGLGGVGVELYGVYYQVSDNPNPRDDSYRPQDSLIATGETDTNGNLTIPFKFRSSPKVAFYLVEAPSVFPRSQRVGVVINPIIQDHQ